MIMPIYVYKCDKCDKIVEEYRQVKDYNMQKSCQCGGTLKHTIVSHAKPASIYPFVDEYMDHEPVVIYSLSHYRKELKKRGLQETGAGRGNKGQWV